MGACWILSPLSHSGNSPRVSLKFCVHFISLPAVVTVDLRKRRLPQMRPAPGGLWRVGRIFTAAPRGYLGVGLRAAAAQPCLLPLARGSLFPPSLLWLEFLTSFLSPSSSVFKVCPPPPPPAPVLLLVDSSRCFFVGDTLTLVWMMRFGCDDTPFDSGDRAALFLPIMKRVHILGSSLPY